MISASIKAKNNYDNILKNLEKSYPIAMEQIMKYAQEKALSYKNGSKNKEMIPYEISNNGKEIIGRLYTNFEWALFQEYGTGQYAEMNHIGKTKLFKLSDFYCWYAPADKVKRQYKDNQYMNINGEMFPMNANINGNKYVMVFSQKANPFMRPTAFALEDQAVNIFTKEIINQMRK